MHGDTRDDERERRDLGGDGTCASTITPIRSRSPAAARPSGA